MLNKEHTTLRSILATDTNLAFTAAIKIIIDLLEYIEEKQSYGMIYPILRPEDITVNEWGGEPEICLPSDIQEHHAYLSPEIKNGHIPDERSTIWSLGMLFIELITGQRVEEYEKNTNRLPDLLELRPDLTEEIALTLYHMVDSDRDLRLENLTSLKSELKRLEALYTDTITSTIDSQGLLHRPISESMIRNRDEKLFSSSRFVGRELELSELKTLILRKKTRLITITGPGGMGKSRLAFELLQQISGNFADGGYFVALNGIRSPAFIILAIANTLGYTFDGKQEPADQLKHYLSRREITLVLDDFDELIAGADVVLDLLDGSPGLHLLVTSRERMNVRSERVFELGGLQIPGIDSKIQGMETGSVRLFEQHAYRVHPALSLETEREGIIRICRLLEGIPLGIELAAQWTRVLTCKEIADEIMHDIDFLETLERDVPERHQGMRVTFDRSWELLSENERNCLKGLSVFHGGFRRDAAEIVAGVTLRLLSVFMNKSLISRNSFGRYRFHELIRQYCDRKLRDDPDLLHNVTSRFMAFYGTFLDRELNHVWKIEHRQIMEEMELELSNIRIAWDSALRHSRFDVLMKMYRPVYTFFETKGWIRESHDFWKNATEIIGTDLHEKSETAHVHMYGCVLSRLAYTYLVRGQFAQARKTFTRAYDILKSLHDSDETIMILAGLGEVASREGEYGTAQQLLRDGLILCKDATDKTAEASLLDSLGIVFMYRGEYDDAQECHEKSMTIWKEHGYQRGIAKNLNNLGNVYYCRGAMDEALFSYEDAITYNTKTGSKRGLRTALSNKGNVLTHKGLYQEAKSIYEECLALAEDLGDLHGVAHAKYQLSITSYSMGDMEDSLRLGKESLAIHEMTGERRGKALVLESLGIASLRMDDLVTAREYLEQAILIFGELDARWGLASSLSNLCKVYIAADEWVEARVPIRKAIDIAISIGSDNIIRDTLTLAARIMEYQGDIESAYRVLTCIIGNQPATNKKPTQAEDGITRLSRILDDDERAEIISSNDDLSLIDCCKQALLYLDAHDII